MKEDPDFVEHHKTDLAASLEKTIVDILMDKLRKVVKDTGIKEVAVAGGVSANNGLRNAFREHAKKIWLEHFHTEVRVYYRQCGHDRHYGIL